VPVRVPSLDPLLGEPDEMAKVSISDDEASFDQILDCTTVAGWKRCAAHNPAKYFEALPTQLLALLDGKAAVTFRTLGRNSYSVRATFAGGEASSA
jgi:hypothetical protein